MLRSPFYANLTAQAEELERTFAMLTDEMSVAVLQWLIKFRLLLPLYAPKLLIEELPGPLSPNLWNIARRNAKARRDLPGAITNEQLLYCWGMGAFSLPERCAVEPGDMVLDARWGAVDTTLYFSRLCGPTGHVHAFEPMPANCARLNASLTMNNVTNVTTVCRVLSDRVGSQKPELPVDTIDNYCQTQHIEHIDFLKISDPNNFEKILLGSKKILAESRPKIAAYIYANEGKDFADIPKLFRAQLHGEYRFYIRHYAPTHRVTIIYAAPV